jgi:peptidase M23-like protein
VRNISLLIALLALALAAGAAGATPQSVPQLVFPVVGAVEYSDDFGAPRAGGPHQGIDILADKRSPAVAAEKGTVKFWTTSATAGCMLYLHGASGTTYLYIHLNNDLTAGNDNRGKCVAGTAYAPGLKDGARVSAGQLVGYVGDSGDANGIHPHLHFEVHPNDGAAVDPYPYLKAARPLLFYAKAGTTVSVTLTGTVVSTVGGGLKVKASQVQVNADKPLSTDRKVTLAVAPDAVLTLPNPFGAGALVNGMTVKASTAPMRATFAAERGDANALVASTIVVGG